MKGSGCACSLGFENEALFLSSVPSLSFPPSLSPSRPAARRHRGQIVDRAWALIVERHPELDTSVADEARAAAEIDLKRSCPPSVRLQNPHPPLLSLGGGRQSVAISSSVAASAEGVEQDRAEGGADGRVSPTPPAEGEDENGNDANADADADGNGDGDNGIHDIRAGDGVGGGVTVMRWDARGKVCQ